MLLKHTIMPLKKHMANMPGQTNATFVPASRKRATALLTLFPSNPMSNAPICENCDVQMVERTNRSTGTTFYGCPNWPECDQTEEHEDNFDAPYGATCYEDTVDLE